MTPRHPITAAALLTLAAALAGCADATQPLALPAPAPSMFMSALPSGPSDQIKDTAWVVGTVTTGGSGPCYGLTTDDGTQYALHAADGTKLVKGVRMRVETRPALVRIDCGPGKLVEMTAAEPLR
jgi:hypothetical protein